MSERLMPLLAGTGAAAYADLRPPRPLVADPGVRVVAIDSEAPGATLWTLSAAASESDGLLLEEVQQRVVGLIRELAAADHS